MVLGSGGTVEVVVVVGDCDSEVVVVGSTTGGSVIEAGTVLSLESVSPPQAVASRHSTKRKDADLIERVIY